MLLSEVAKAQEIFNRLHYKGELDFLSMKQLKAKIVRKPKYESYFKNGLKIEKSVNNPRGKPTRHLEEFFLIDENHPFSNFPQKYEASLGELNPIEIKVAQRFWYWKGI